MSQSLAGTRALEVRRGVVVSEPAPKVRVRDLSVVYGAQVALEGVDLDVAPGEVLALIGPSGCGKTSLLWSLNRMSDLVSGCRVEGEVHLGSAAVLGAGVDTRALRRRVGLIFQRPNPFPLSIRRNLELGLLERGLGGEELEGAVRRNLEAVGLWREVGDRLDAPALELSGGQQQRLCIARALALEPEVLLFDEPCSALDPLSTGVVEELVASLRGRYTVVVVTHNLGQARRISDRAAFFWMEAGRGRLVEVGPTARLFEEPRDPRTAAYVRGLAG